MVRFGGKRQRVLRTADGDDFIFHRLAHHFEDVCLELSPDP